MCYAHEQDTAERHDRYMLIAEILGEVAGYLKDPL